MLKPSTVTAPAELLAHLVGAWPEVKRTRLKQWLKHEAITVNGRPVTQFNHLLVPGDVVAIRAGKDAAPRLVLPGGIGIIFEDQDLIVIDKPEGLLSIASVAEEEKTVYFLLTAYLRGQHLRHVGRVWIVHRLDRETSGLMVFAKNAAAKSFLQTHWDEAEKCYEAIVEGRLASDHGTFESDFDETNPYRVRSVPAGEHTRHAVTHFRVLARSPWHSRVAVTLGTGRRHQIRVHLSEAGHPVVGDKKYGSTTDPAKRLGLHAVSLRLTHPTTGRPLHFTSPLPSNLADLVRPPRKRPSAT